MAVDPTAAPTVDPGDARDAQLSSLYTDYNPQGGMGGLFAPAYIHGLKASEDAVSKWGLENHPVTYANIDQTRMPNPFQGPSPMSAGNGVYGGPIPLQQAYGDPKGSIDPEALRVLAQGGKYDFNARRDAIAQRLASNQAAQAAVPPPAATDSSMFLDENGQPFDIQAYQSALAQYNQQKSLGNVGNLPPMMQTPPLKSRFPISKNYQDYNNVGA